MEKCVRVMDVGVYANNFTPVPWRNVVKNLDGGMELDEQGMRERGDIHRHHPYSFDAYSHLGGIEEGAMPL